VETVFEIMDKRYDWDSAQTFQKKTLRKLKAYHRQQPYLVEDNFFQIGFDQHKTRGKIYSRISWQDIDMIGEKI
jgi:hypothetical protein